MPTQSGIFLRGWRTGLSRLIIVFLCTFFILTLFVFNFRIPRHAPSRELREYQTAIPKISSSVLNPFRQAANPLVQKNSTNGVASWYSNWNWLSPFSSSVTLDENKSLLPPTSYRPPIYTYHEFSMKEDESDINDARNELLLTWKRAWWANGFKPIILSPVDAMKNPLSVKFQMKDINVSLRNEISRWLAWENRGTGILCDYMLLPMGNRADPLLESLRRVDFPRLTRFENLENGLFAGPESNITAALNQALISKNLKNARDFISALVPETFVVEPKHAALAYYDRKTISDKYPKIADEINSQSARGLSILNQLILCHLHSTWQNIFHRGIAVVKPLPSHMTVIVEPALTLATVLSRCPESPLPASCPPNFIDCKPCVASHPLKISTPSSYLNISSTYTIGIVPHPYTNAILASSGKDIDISWVRRVSERDPWISALTKDILGTGISGPPRVAKFKEAVASEYGTSNSLWITAEHALPEDLDWYFGFKIPPNTTSDGKSESPVPGPERRPKKVSDPLDGPVPTEGDLELERKLLKQVKKWDEESISEDQEIVRKAIEAWNLADTEAWRFTRAFSARITFDWLEWKKKEKGFSD